MRLAGEGAGRVEVPRLEGANGGRGPGKDSRGWVLVKGGETKRGRESGVGPQAKGGSWGDRRREGAEPERGVV